MIEVSRDGRRIYVTNALYTPWDDQFYPDGVEGWMAKIDVPNGGGMRLDPRFFLKTAGMRTHQVRLEGDLYALMDAFAAQVQRKARRGYKPRPQVAYPLEDARDRLRSLLPELQSWTSLQGVAPQRQDSEGPTRASFLASTLSASLELVKEGAMEARQLEAFADVYVRRRKEQPAP